MEGVVDPVPMAKITIKPRKTKLGVIPSIMMHLKKVRLKLLPEKAEK